MTNQEKVKKRGNRLGMAIFRASLKMFGLSATYGLLYFVCLYYLVFDRIAVASGMAYIKRRFRGHGYFRRLIGVYRIFINQGKNLIDRYYLISGLGRFDIELSGYDKLNALLGESRKGVILLTAHVGNWQVAMTVLEKLGRTVYLVMRPEENAAVKEALNIDSEQGKVRIISSESFLGGVVEIMSVIDQGCLVSIMGDRSYGRNFTEAVLMGDSVKLPHGAFSIAAAAECPVVVLWSARLSAKKYIVDVSHIIRPVQGTKTEKNEKIRACVQEFAGILDNYADRYPFQWFVFGDIWEGNSKLN
jgi:predicted LPLAT superfamily acyltransferase